MVMARLSVGLLNRATKVKPETENSKTVLYDIQMSPVKTNHAGERKMRMLAINPRAVFDYLRMTDNTGYRRSADGCN
jgi:hypothetical protein